MKRLLLVCVVAMCCSLAGTGQTTYWSDDFISPEGWTLEDNWSIETGILQFSWDPTIIDFDEHAISELITLDDHVNELRLNQSLQVYNPTENEHAQLIIATNDEDYVLWNYTLINGNWGNTFGSDTSFSLEQFAGETIQIKFRTYGSTTFNWSYWQVFDVQIMATYMHDLEVTNIQGPKNIDLFENGDWAVEVTNHGTEAVAGYTINLLDSKSGMIVDDIVENNIIGPGESKVYGFSWIPNTAKNTLMYGLVESEEDQFATNNLSQSLFLRIEPDIDYSILVWEHDNGIQSIVSPELSDLITPIEGMIRALDDAGLEYDLYTYLPENLDDYTMVIATLGNYCLS